MKNILIGQAGGPTAVINTTLANLVKSLEGKHNLFYSLDGYEGIVRNNILKGTNDINKWIISNENIPGACLGSGRYSIAEEDLAQILTNLQRNKIDTLVFIGGNGTMTALSLIASFAEEQTFKLQVVGLPKTVDNDIGLTDHAPGFASAASFIAHEIRDMNRDLYSMRNFETIRVIETMGRNAGWLAYASGFFKNSEAEGPHFIAIPEKNPKLEDIEKIVEESLEKYGYALIVVSEGVTIDYGTQKDLDIVDGRVVLGGISSVIAEHLQKKFNRMVRSEILSMNQRSSSTLVSKIDRTEAKLIGETGAKYIEQEKTKVMPAVIREDSPNYQIRLSEVNIENVASIGERELPSSFLNNYEEYRKWLEPLIMEPESLYPEINYLEKQLARDGR